MVQANDNRRLNRIPIRLVVSQGGRSAPLGQTRDLSLHGTFIETTAPLDVGAVVPLSLGLDSGEIKLRAEVVRKNADGMGLEFLPGPRAATRRLRKLVAELTSAEGTRRTVERLHDAARHVEPIKDTARIAELLEAARGDQLELTLIAHDRALGERFRIASIRDQALRLDGVDPTTLSAGDRVFALVTMDFVSYSFEVQITEVSGTAVTTTRPSLIVYSERRNRMRRAASKACAISWPAPWDPSERLRFTVCEESDGGLSFRVDAPTCHFVPGTPLEGAVLERPDATVALDSAEVRHITAIEEGGARWLRVGVSHGARYGSLQVGQVALRPSGGAWSRFRATLVRAGTAARYLFHRGRRRVTGRATQPTETVRIPGGRHELVGLLDSTAPKRERLRCPLVVVIPGFAGRKEQMSLFASVVVDGFRRNHRDVVVLRIDGSNNLGESGKDPGCDDDGKHTLHYTISGTVDDTLAVLDWARTNRRVDPSHIVLVSTSMGSIAARAALTRDETSGVNLWVSYMGAADARDTVRHVSGHLDLFEQHAAGLRVGYQSLVGCLVDGDRFFADLQALRLGTLDDARREMAAIRADVLWLAGLHDGWVDIRRVRELMRVEGIGPRELIEVDSGHLPKTGEEAVAHFTLITRRIWQHVHATTMPEFSPPLGRFAAAAREEWASVRARQSSIDRTAWWRRYLMNDQGGLGFDILQHSPAYEQLLTDQVALLEPAGQRVLDLGAGTGNLTARLLDAGAREVVAVDLVSSALERLQQKISRADGEDAPVTVITHDLDGNPLTAMRRWIAGELSHPRLLVERVPGVHRVSFERILEAWDDELQAATKGYEVDLEQCIARHRLPVNAARLLRDLHRLARHASGRENLEGGDALESLPRSVIDHEARLPLREGSFDRVVMSLLVSYLSEPDDTLWRARQLLRPGGLLVLSTPRRNADSSIFYRDLIQHFEGLADEELPGGATRDELMAGARVFLGASAELGRLEEEGFFRFYDPDELTSLVARRGFVDVHASLSFGTPAQAVLVSCRKP